MSDALPRMTMLDIHENALASSNVPYHDFLLFYRMGEKMVYSFVEGKTDSSFYRGFFESILKGDWGCKIIPAGNKEKVLGLYSSLDWNRFPRNAICFFVDRDLSDFLEGEKHQGINLFVTESYSIENELLTEHTMERVLEEICCVGVLHPTELQKLKELFLVNLRLFQDSLACVMAQVILWRRSQKMDDNLIVRLDKLKVKAFFEFRSGCLTLKSEFFPDANRVKHAAEVVKGQLASTHELKTAELEFRENAGVEKFIRGKYLISFFLECIEALRLAIPLLFNRHIMPPGKSANVGEANAMMIIGPRARCPASLRAFLERNYIEHIKQTGDAKSAGHEDS
jgi:hypothetical protein